MKKPSLNNLIFIAVLLLLSCGILFGLVRNRNEYNLVDNRMSYKFELPSAASLLSGEYQGHLDDVIADQMPKYNYFKLLYLRMVNYVNTGTASLLKWDRSDRYVRMNDISLYHDCLLYDPISDEYLQEVAAEDIAEINRIAEDTDADVYFCFIETDSNINFETGEKTNDAAYFRDSLNLGSDRIGIWEISSFNEYKDLFYRTDHHWNHRGSYECYRQIADLMHFDEVLQPQKEIRLDNARLSGTKAQRIAGIKTYADVPAIYEFDYPEFTIFASGKELSAYGASAEALRQAAALSYADIYGGDYDELIFINREAANDRKLLIYSNSYSNAVNKLLAAGYGETYVIDGRHFHGKSMVDYINENGIDDVLILANCMLFWDDISW